MNTPDKTPDSAPDLPCDPAFAALMEKLSGAIDGQSPQDALSALMLVYVATAKTHGSCTGSAALLCVTTASHLQKAARRPVGAPLH